MPSVVSIVYAAREGTGPSFAPFRARYFHSTSLMNWIFPYILLTISLSVFTNKTGTRKLP